MGYSDKPWLKSYQLGPYKLATSLAPYPQAPLFLALDEAAFKYPSKPAIQFLDQTIKYQTLATLTNRMAAALVGLGVQPRDRVCLFLPNCPEFIISDWAILKAGAAVVPTSVLRTDEGLAYEAGSSGARLIICHEAHIERVLGVSDQLGLEHVIVVAKDGYMSSTRRSLPSGRNRN